MGACEECITNTDSVDEPPRNQHADAIAGGLESSPDEPEQAGEHDGVATSPSIGDWACDDGTDDRATGQCCADASLGGSMGVIEVGHILRCADDGAHAADVETEPVDGVSWVWE